MIVFDTKAAAAKAAGKSGSPLNNANIRFVFWCTMLNVGLAVAAVLAFALTGRSGWVNIFLNYPGAIFLVEMAAIQFKFSRSAWKCFAPGQPLAAGWLLITASAACHLVGAVCTQVLGADTTINPLANAGRFPAGTLADIRQFGLLVGGPLQMVLLALGLGRVLASHRRFGLLNPPDRWWWLALGVMAAYSVREALDVASVIRAGDAFHPGAMIWWVTDPLLLILVAEASCLYRSSRAMGGGLVARCWGAFAVAVFLTCLADAFLRATTTGYLPWTTGSVSWYVWLPVSAAYALGPAWQVEAVTRAAGKAA